MSWMVNSEALQKEFRQKVLNYAAIVVNDGKEDVATYFTQSMCTDTFGIKMYTEKAVYLPNTEIRGSENREPERTEHLNGVAVLGTSEGRGKNG